MDPPPNAILLTADLAACYTGRPASTIRRWASEGRITTYGRGRGNIRYNLHELPGAVRDEWTDELTPGQAPPLPDKRRGGDA